MAQLNLSLETLDRSLAADIYGVVVVVVVEPGGGFGTTTVGGVG
jgi:hypothetical protein